MQYTTKTHTPEETIALAKDLIKDLAVGGVILLRGELGSGKTHFVQGLANSLGVKNRVHSPTFTLMHEYTADHKNIKQLVHVDLYRLDNIEKINALDLPKYAEDPSILLVVEWPSKIHYQWPNVIYDVSFSIENGEKSNNGRSLTINHINA